MKMKIEVKFFAGFLAIAVLCGAYVVRNADEINERYDGPHRASPARPPVRVIPPPIGADVVALTKAPPIVGNPHPRMFQFLLNEHTPDHSREIVIHEFTDCSTGYCAKGIYWGWTHDADGEKDSTLVLWQVITELDGKPAQIARSIYKTRCSYDDHFFDLAHGIMIFKPKKMFWEDEDGVVQAGQFMVINMDIKPVSPDADRYGMPDDSLGIFPPGCWQEKYAKEDTGPIALRETWHALAQQVEASTPHHPPPPYMVEELALAQHHNVGDTVVVVGKYLRGCSYDDAVAAVDLNIAHNGGVKNIPDPYSFWEEHCTKIAINSEWQIKEKVPFTTNFGSKEGTTLPHAFYLLANKDGDQYWVQKGDPELSPDYMSFKLKGVPLRDAESIRKEAYQNALKAVKAAEAKKEANAGLSPGAIEAGDVVVMYRAAAKYCTWWRPGQIEMFKRVVDEKLMHEHLSWADMEGENSPAAFVVNNNEAFADMAHGAKWAIKDLCEKFATGRIEY
jgi:hypothetical protein